MQQGWFVIKHHTCIAKDVYEMDLSGDTTAITAAGQFVNIRIDGCYLRRPISVCAVDTGVLRLIYKVVGAGTKCLSEMQAGEKLDLLCGLGNGYDLSCSGTAPLLIGGGVGVPPLYEAAKRLRAAGKEVTVLLGFRSACDVFYTEQFASLGCQVRVATEDESSGTRGFVTDILPPKTAYSYVYTCGPEPMLRAVYQAVGGIGQYSFEQRMACGFGACMGCSCQTITGYKRICKEGPVLRGEEILWNQKN